MQVEKYLYENIKAYKKQEVWKYGRCVKNVCRKTCYTFGVSICI